MTELLGFIAQCAICPQRAVVATQPTSGWVCPRCAGVVDESVGFGDVDVAAAEPLPVRVPTHDPLALALVDALPSAGRAVAMVGDQMFVLKGVVNVAPGCQHDTAYFETRWVPADPGCEHRYCKRQAAGFCLGVAAAQMDMIEDQQRAQDRARLDPDWPASEVQG